MKRALLDGNVFDKLRDDQDTATVARLFCEQHALELLITRTIHRELIESPFMGIPHFVPITVVGNTVGRVGLLAAGDRLGAGAVFSAHRGESSRDADALIADAADYYADWLVSEDARLRRRLQPAGGRCMALTYSEFAAAVRLL